LSAEPRIWDTYTTRRDGVDLSYRVAGKGDVDVVLIHGWMVSGRVYDNMVEQFGSLGARFFIPDLRGTGSSSRPETGYELDDYVHDVMAVADHAGLKRFVVVGHSMGGQIAQLLCADHPDRVLGQVLLCPVPAAGMELPPDACALFENCAQDPQSIATILSLACLDLSDPDQKDLVAMAMDVPDACIRTSFKTWTRGGIESRLPDIVAPTVVVATDDPFLPPEFLQAAVVDPIADARLEIIRGAGHYVQTERPAETAAILRSFVSKVAS